MLGIDQAAIASRINPAAVDSAQVPITEPVARDLGLRDGEIVKGIIKADGDALKLVLNGLPVVLPDGHGFHVDQAATFRVVQSAGGLLLQPVRVAASATAATPAPLPKAAQATPAALNTLLSLLLHPPQLPALMQVLSGGLIERALKALGATDQAAASRLAKPTMARLTATALRKAVAGAGLWNEAALAKGKSPLDADTKALLLQLRDSDDAAGVKELASSALIDIESAQLQAVQARANQELLLNLIIPFTDANPVRLTFQRPAPSKELPDPPYTVNMHSQNNALGEIWLKTVITAKTQVDMTMWARQATVAAAASEGSRALALELEKAGLRMNSFLVYNNARQDRPAGAALPGAIVNVQA